MEKRKAYAYYEERSGRELQVEMGKRLNFPSHLHGELELFLVQSGCVCVGIDGEFRELKAGELAVVFPNTCCTPCTAFTAAGVPGRTAAFPARCSI